MPSLKTTCWCGMSVSRAVWSIAGAVRPSRAIAATGGFACPPASAISSGPSPVRERTPGSMPQPIPTAEKDPPEPDSAEPPWPCDLGVLRTELDRIDDGLHDLLMRRAEVVRQVAASGAKNGMALRPGREAAILRRLLARHAGALPPQAVVRIWRELLAGTTAMQGPFVIAVCDSDPGAGFIQAAREQFGALTPLRVHGSAAQAIADVSAGRATVAVLALPSETEAPREAWWMALLQKDEPRIHVVARLPFWTRRPEGAPTTQALVVAAIAPD